MTFTELKTFLRASILRKTTAAISDDMLGTAILLAHRQLQRDGDWRCQEAHVEVEYPAADVDGVSVADDCKRIRHVWVICEEGLRGPILGTDEDNALRVKGEAFRQRGHTDLNPSITAQRWFERERKLCLLIPPPADQDLRVDYYKYLPAYSDGEEAVTNDFFSDELWDVLLYGAAHVGSLSLWEHGNAEGFGKTYALLLERAIGRDAQFKLATGSRRRTAVPTGRSEQ